MTENNKRFVVIADTDLEISIKDNLTKRYPFSEFCDDLIQFNSLLKEVTNVCDEMNKRWEQTQRFENYNKRLVEENEQLKQKIKSITEILNEDIGYIDSFKKIEEVLK